jgi:rubrerythrin
VNAKRARKANMRRKFFNKGKGALCDKCGTVLVDRLGVKECPVCK